MYNTYIMYNIYIYIYIYIYGYGHLRRLVNRGITNYNSKTTVELQNNTLSFTSMAIYVMLYKHFLCDLCADVRITRFRSFDDGLPTGSSTESTRLLILVEFVYGA